MAESVIVHGRDLVVEQVEGRPKAGEPIRHRSNRQTPAPAEPAPSLVDSTTVRYSNPFWSQEANEAADNRPEGVTPRDVARQYKNHRIEDQ